jgi:hypothetical protein
MRLKNARPASIVLHSLSSGKRKGEVKYNFSVKAAENTSQ